MGAERQPQALRSVPAAGLLSLRLAAMVLTATPAAAEGPNSALAPALYDTDRLSDYAAQVSWRFVHNEGNRTWVCRGVGSAIFLGGNRFLTAAHVVDQNPFTDDCADYGIADPVIEFGTTQLAGRVVKVAPWDDRNGLVYPGGMDLALIAVDARMIPVALRSAAPLALCDSEPPAAMAVRVATEYGVGSATTRLRVTELFARIDFLAKRGDSGGGVFDPVRRCLIGIISSGGREGANYVPSAAIRVFLADQEKARFAGRCGSGGINDKAATEHSCDEQ
jgi:hypothetical protein